MVINMALGHHHLFSEDEISGRNLKEGVFPARGKRILLLNTALCSSNGDGCCFAMVAVAFNGAERTYRVLKGQEAPKDGERVFEGPDVPGAFSRYAESLDLGLEEILAYRPAH